MIVKMLKLHLLLYYKDKTRILENLRDLGIVHVEEKAEISSKNIEQTQSLLKKIEQIILSLHKKIKEKKIKRVNEDIYNNIEKIVEEWETVEREKQILETKKTNLIREMELLSKWGDFDPELIYKLSNEGIYIKFYEIPTRIWNKISQEINFIPISYDKKIVRAVIFFKEGSSSPNIESIESVEEIKLPELSLSKLKDDIKDISLKIDELEKKEENFLKYLFSLERKKDELLSNLRLEIAMQSLSEYAEGKILYLLGWIPEYSKEKIKSFLEKEKVWFELSQPLPEDNPPIVLKNDFFSKLFEPIMQLYGLPNYNEIDPTPFFAPFMMMFVGLCIGDLAYGLILFLLSLFLYIKVPKKFKGFALLGIFLGISTMIAGTLLNSFFGITIAAGDKIPGPAIFSSGGEKLILSSIKTEKGTFYPMMPFALLIGFIQIMLAFIIRTVNKIKSSGIKGAAVPLSFIFFTLGALVCGAHINFLNLGIGRFSALGINFGSLLLKVPFIVGKIMFFGSFPLNILFSNADKKGGDRIIMIIVDLYNSITGIFGNILSYLRIFALGLTGGLLGGAFNFLAGMIVNGKTGIGLVFAGFGAFLILIMGHSLNFLLAMIGAGVHPLRLTFVEFFQNLDFSWGGRLYKPLTKN